MVDSYLAHIPSNKMLVTKPIIDIIGVNFSLCHDLYA